MITVDLFGSRGMSKSTEGELCSNVPSLKEFDEG